MILSITTFPWGRTSSLNQFTKVLSEIRRIGFEGVGLEYGILPSALKKNPHLVRNIMEKAQLKNGGTYSPGALTRISWAKSSGTPLIWVSAKAPKRSLAIQKLRKFAELAKANGIIAALHNELGSSFQTSADIRTALDSIKDLTLCLDTAHGIAAGVDLEKTIEAYSDRLTLVHLKDLRAKIPINEVKFTRDFVNVGRGIIDLKSVVEKLKDVKYEGELMLEIEALQGQEPKESVREGFEYVRKNLLV